VKNSCKNTDTQSEYVILIAFPRQQQLRYPTSMLRYMYIACLVILWFLHCVVTKCSNISGEHTTSIFSSRWLYTRPIPSSLFHSCDWSNCLKRSYVDPFPPLGHFNIHLHWFSHSVYRQYSSETSKRVFFKFYISLNDFILGASIYVFKKTLIL
jgi:hypothetical protein